MSYAENRKARFNYEILEKYEAGIELLGTEVKSVPCGQIFTRLCPCSVCINNKSPTVYALHPHVLFSKFTILYLLLGV